MENNTGCPVKSCLCKLLCFALPVFIFLFIAGYVVHHVWLMPVYQQTPSLWRPPGEMKEMMPWFIAYYAALSLSISWLFCKVKKARMQACGTGEASDPECKIGGRKCPIRFGIGFGGFIGILLGTANAGFYIWMPIPGELAARWFTAWFIEGIGIGIILSLVWHCKQKRCVKE